MGEKREGDARVPVIICLFFICILAGGALLSLYIFLPETESSEWYYLTGIVLEAIPWIFWLFAYLYTCFKPREGSGGSGISPKGGGGGWKPPSSRTNSGAAAGLTSPVGSPACNAPRHVHFGEVVVVGNNEDGSSKCSSGADGSMGGGQERGDYSPSNDRTTSGTSNVAELSIGSRESEMPLKLGASSSK